MMSLPQGELYANLVFYFYWRKDLHPDFESFQFKAQMQALGSLGCFARMLAMRFYPWNRPYRQCCTWHQVQQLQVTTSWL